MPMTGFYTSSTGDDPKPRKKRRAIFKGILLFVAFLLAGIAAFASVLGVIVLQEINRDLPDPKHAPTPSLTSVVYDRKGRVLARLFEENRTWVDLSHISPWAIKSVLAAEDSEFYQHQGIRLQAIFRALLLDFQMGKARHGGSTITQQLARTIFLSRERTIQRKASEAIIAIRMEKAFTKDQILEMYLNMAYFGHGAYGIAAASQTYFDKPASQLSLPEASMLAGLLPAPNAYTPLRHEDKAKIRQAYVLNRMVETGMITTEEKSHAFRTQLKYAGKKGEKASTSPIKDAPYFVSHILFKHLLPKYGRDRVYRGGLKVYSTIDLELQQLAESIVSKMKFEGALVALDPNTGEILALVGGRNFGKSKFNRATQAYRQPGSAFKPIVYATAVEKGNRPVDHILDAPLTFPNGWSPQNSDGKNRGEITLIEALALSVNTAAVRLAQVVGINAIIETAKNMGISTPYLPENLSIALGSGSLTPLELGAAFCVFANNGYRIEPFGVREILDNNGDSLEQTGPTLKSALSPEVAVTVRSMLMEAVSWGTGTRAKVENYQVFGKTGTTNEWIDAWFVGGVPGLVVVVYVGNDNHKSLGRAFGGTVAAPVWKEFVQKAVKILKMPNRFIIPSNVSVESITICRKTGFLATPSCPKANIMVLIGQAPDSVCPWHGGSSRVAAGDVNAPQLILAPNDENLRAAFQMRHPGRTTHESSVEEPEVELRNKPAQPAEASQPPAPSVEPYKNDPTPASAIEKRYQELLKQYNVK